MTAGVEPLLLEALDAEWAAQSDRARPLVPSPMVRDTLELAAAATPAGILGLAGELPAEADTPQELLRSLRHRLPDTADPWTLRVLGRMRTLPRPPEKPQLEARAGLELEAPPAPVTTYTPPPVGGRSLAAVAGIGGAGAALGVLAVLVGGGL